MILEKLGMEPNLADLTKEAHDYGGILQIRF